MLCGNEVRDKDNYDKLKKLGWKILIVWECETKKEQLGEVLKDLFEIRAETLK